MAEILVLRCEVHALYLGAPDSYASCLPLRPTRRQAFIKFVPLKVGLPALGAVLLLIQARAKFIASKRMPRRTYLSTCIVSYFLMRPLHWQAEARMSMWTRHS